MTEKVDILVLGATGFTGALICRYLAAHPQRSQFSLAIAGRSAKKLSELSEALNQTNPREIFIVLVDVTKPKEVELAVQGARVVINAVGPYWLWGTPVVRACVRNGVHYVDLAGETAWIKQIINEFDYFATKTKVVVVPACGFDSIPSDISAYLANKTIKTSGLTTHTGEPLTLGSSLSAFRMPLQPSGGTVASFMTAMEKVPRNALRLAATPFALSPYVGSKYPILRFLYNLAVPGAKTLEGATFVMSKSNTAVVQRTYGLLELQGRTSPPEVAKATTYGSDFCYDEFMVTSGTFAALAFTATLALSAIVVFIKPLRYLAKIFLPAPGEGPSDAWMAKGFLQIINISSTTSTPPVQVKTVINGKGDPGYLLSSVMIAECALCFLLPPASADLDSVNPGCEDNLHALPRLAREGGVLTPMTAFGDVLIQRLEESGRFQFSSSIIESDGQKKAV